MFHCNSKKTSYLKLPCTCRAETVNLWWGQIATRQPVFEALAWLFSHTLFISLSQPVNVPVTTWRRGGGEWRGNVLSSCSEGQIRCLIPSETQSFATFKDACSSLFCLCDSHFPVSFPTFVTVVFQDLTSDRPRLCLWPPGPRSWTRTRRAIAAVRSGTATLRSSAGGRWFDSCMLSWSCCSGTIQSFSLLEVFR